MFPIPRGEAASRDLEPPGHIVMGFGHPRRVRCLHIKLTTVVWLLLVSGTLSAATDADDEARVSALLGKMTLAEKIGQMSQLNGADGEIPDGLRETIRSGRVGSILNEVDVAVVNELQRTAVEESRLGIPLLMGRDVIHGFRTVLPIPLGLAATFNPELVRRGARIAALEAAAAGVNWTFAPMIDISRDPRWGRIAESFGEDPYLTGVLAVAMVEGFQGEDLALPGTIAACAKHFAGYGASEAGRDYGTTNIAENELRNVYLPPFKAAVDAGVATLMASFSDLNGIPASGNRFLMTQVLREEWGFDGFVVSDWASIEQLTVHGFTANDREAAYEALNAGVNMEMATSVYADNLQTLLAQGRITEARIDAMVAEILRVKIRLGLFESPYTDPRDFPAASNDRNLATARESALQSIVLLENRDGALPLNRDDLGTLAVIGPLADDPYEQLGTWIFDGDQSISQTPLQAIRHFVGEGVDVRHVKAMNSTRSRSRAAFGEALAAAKAADAILVFLGEESILSGEAHSRADISLPGNQADLVRTLGQAGKPLIAVIMAGRPLTLGNILDDVDALVFAWHPGSMGGPAIADILFGVASPSGKLPVTFPKMVGQVPIYYAHKQTGRPATPETFMHIDDIPVRLPQSSTGFVSNHLDAGYEPQYPFGHGLSYGRFVYSEIEVSGTEIPLGDPVTLQAVVRNEGTVAAEEVVQLYVRDLVGRVTRPVRELKGFRRVRLAPGESRSVSFELSAQNLAFYGRDMRPITEPGAFHAWIGGSSEADLQTEFSIIESSKATPVPVEQGAP
jgi:beta-glucosidase